jgi:hypothetical protein
MLGGGVSGTLRLYCGPAEGEAMLSKGSVGVRVLVVAALAVALAAPAGAAATDGAVGSCPSTTYEQPFAPWLDFADYVLAPDGGLESGAAGWSLAGGATVARENENFYVRAARDSRSLSLPSGASATTSSMCVDATSPDLRFFVRRTSGSLLSMLKVEVLYTDVLGQPRALTVAALPAGPSWQPTPPVAFLANLTLLPLVTNGTTDVAFRFTPLGSSSEWMIDDVYVDPFKGE